MGNVTLVVQLKSGDKSVLEVVIPYKFESIDKDDEKVEKIPLKEVEPGKYDVYINDTQIVKDVSFKIGGVYTVVGQYWKTGATGGVLTDVEPNSIHMFWMLPQYIIISLGEVMFSVTGLEFAFTQAPESMKSLLTAAWHLTVSVGNLIVIIIAEISFFDSIVRDTTTLDLYYYRYSQIRLVNI